MRSVVNRQWCLAKRPEGHLSISDFRWHEKPVPDVLPPNQVLVRTIYLSLDPTNRIWASDMDQYMPPVEIGEVMRGANLGIVEASNNASFLVGSIVTGIWGWQSYYHGPADGLGLVNLIDGVPLSAYISVLGINGMTAYFGLFEAGRVEPSDTVVVSAAAGSVGSLVGQMARIQGCRVVGIAGGAAKCQWLTEVLGFDEAVDYKAPDWQGSLNDVCPEGVDLYFDNVGGEISDGVIEQMNCHGCIVICGIISRYNEPEPWPGPANYGLVLMRRLTIKGFLVSDYFARFAEGIKIVSNWLAEGRLRYNVDIEDGLRSAPEALDRLFRGTNRGKLLVRCSAEPWRYGDSYGCQPGNL